MLDPKTIYLTLVPVGPYDVPRHDDDGDGAERIVAVNDGGTWAARRICRCCSVRT